MSIAASYQHPPSIDRAIRGLSVEHQQIIQERYARLLPVLNILMRSHDIYERNRTWPGTRPLGKVATSWLDPKRVPYARDIIYAHSAQVDEENDILWKLFYAYCRYGPIGLIDALPTDDVSVIPDELQECATFHRLAKHPRSDAGIYIRKLLNAYADALDYPRLPPFLARYAFASERKLERWFFPEGESTEHVVKTTRRLNLAQLYPHRRWQTGMICLPLICQLAGRHQQRVHPWLIWMADTSTGTLMGFRLCPYPPTDWDVLLTLRWSIWHFDAPWWNARGSPDELMVPAAFSNLASLAPEALGYLHITVYVIDSSTMQQEDRQDGFPAPPPLIDTVLATLHQRQRVNNDLDRFTLTEIRALILDLIHEQQQKTFAVSPSRELCDRGVSLPWHEGIGAAGLLPSVAFADVTNKTIMVHGVPYDIESDDLRTRMDVAVRFDPDDARQVAAVYGRVHVMAAHAAAFEHHMSWWDLISEPQWLLQ